MSDGFLGRWSRRKLDVKEGKAVEAEPAVAGVAGAVGTGSAVVPPPQPSPSAGGGNPDSLPPPLGEGRGGGTAATESPPAPTLADADLLTPSSDFTRFAARDVAPDVKNAAMKKLFADPHFNVMDGLDTYIDDYSQPDPMPESMLRQLASVKFLKLFDEKTEADPVVPREVADDPATQTVAQSPPEPEAVPEHADDANPDLRLQPDDAAPGEDPGRGTS
ncbi:MAG: DUF3306 domain-containing protein [Pseudomonadota bacterium]